MVVERVSSLERIGIIDERVVVIQSQGRNGEKMRC
jgi:hypothetical protein